MGLRRRAAGLGRFAVDQRLLFYKRDAVGAGDGVAHRYKDELSAFALFKRDIDNLRFFVGRLADAQRPALSRVLNGPSDDPFGSLNLVGGLRRAMAKAGYCDLKEFQKVGLTVGA